MDMGIVNLSSLDSVANAVRWMQQQQQRQQSHRRVQSPVMVILPFHALDGIARDNHRRTDLDGLATLRDFVTLFGQLPGFREIHCKLRGRRLPELWETGRLNDDAPLPPDRSHFNRRNGEQQRRMDVTRELDRFFGIVLPRYPTVIRICLTAPYLPTTCFRHFTEGVASAAASGASALRDLHLDGAFLGVEGARLLGIMLGGGNREGAETSSRGMSLNEVRIRNGELGSDGLRHVCEGVGRMTRLNTLHVYDPLVNILPGTVVAAVATTTGTPQRHSHMKALEILLLSWSREAFVELVTALRNHPTLERVRVRRQDGNAFEDAGLVESLLEMHNFTLSSLEIEPLHGDYDLPKLNSLLLRNRRVRAIHERLERHKYRVPRRELWPHYLGEVGPFPSLLYRFVRRGNLDAFVEHMAGQGTLSATSESKGSRKKRSHDQLHSSGAAST